MIANGVHIAQEQWFRFGGPDVESIQPCWVSMVHTAATTTHVKKLSIGRTWTYGGEWYISNMVINGPPLRVVYFLLAVCSRGTLTDVSECGMDVVRFPWRLLECSSRTSSPSHFALAGASSHLCVWLVSLVLSVSAHAILVFHLRRNPIEIVGMLKIIFILESYELT